MSKNPHSPVFSDTPTYHETSYYGDKFRTDGLSAIDWLGHTFNLGDRVMYCIAAGRGQMMAIGVVKQIRAKEVDVVEYRQDDDEGGRFRPVVVGQRWEVEVQVLTERTSGNWDNAARTKPAWVNPMNITALPEGFPE